MKINRNFLNSFQNVKNCGLYRYKRYKKKVGTMKHKKLIIGMCLGAAGAAGAISVSRLITKRLTQYAIDREAPKSLGHFKGAFSGASSKIPEEVQKVYDDQRKAAEKLESSDLKEVSVTSFDGLKLVGHMSTCESPKRLIIAFHGWRSSWSTDFGLVSDFWQENDCNVLYAEQRGQNGSEGDYIGFGLLERNDCLTWANWANEQNFDLPVYLCGLSMGATTVLMAAGLKLPECVHGIIADCGFTSPYAITKHVTEKNLHLPYYGMRERQVAGICSKAFNSENYRYSCTQALKDACVPILFIHGTADKFVPVEMTYENYLACASPKRLLIVPGADHGMSFIVERDRYEKAVINFWNDFDGK